MHDEILTKEQKDLLPYLKEFSNDFGLVGGTAVALYIGHRRSIDFDLFTLKPLNSEGIKTKLRKNFSIEHEYVDQEIEYKIRIKGVKITFYSYRFPIEFPVLFSDLHIADLLTIAAMKAHALGGRAKWKDYVDLFFIMRQYHSLEEISAKAYELFKGEHNEKLFRQRLALFFDINYDESVEFMSGFEVEEQVIKEYLKDAGLT